MQSTPVSLRSCAVDEPPPVACCDRQPPLVELVVAPTASRPAPPRLAFWPSASLLAASAHRPLLAPGRCHRSSRAARDPARSTLAASGLARSRAGIMVRSDRKGGHRSFPSSAPLPAAGGLDCQGPRERRLLLHASKPKPAGWPWLRWAPVSPCTGPSGGSAVSSRALLVHLADGCSCSPPPRLSRRQQTCNKGMALCNPRALSRVARSRSAVPTASFVTLLWPALAVPTRGRRASHGSPSSGSNAPAGRE